MWQRLHIPTKKDLSALAGEKRQKIAKFYADEDIEEGAVELIRSWGFNITSAREIGARGMPDSFHAAHAFKEKRFLITKNGRDFLDDSKLPRHRLHGLIVVSIDPRNARAYVAALSKLFMIAPFGDFYVKSKIQASENELKIVRASRRGHITKSRYKWERGELYTWTEPEVREK